MSMQLDQSKPFTDEEKRWCHEWGVDHLVEENERRHAQSDLHDEGKPVDVRKAFADAGVQVPDPPPNPTYVGAMGSVQQGPLIVEGEDNAGRVPLPRDHPLQQEVIEGEGDGLPSNVEPWDGRAVRAEVNTLTVDDLKDNLRGLDEAVSGTKDELRDRLVKALKRDHDERAKGE